MNPILALVSSNWIFPALAIYALIFLVAVTGLGFWSRRKRRERVPVEFKLLRGPGETLRRKLAVIDENLFFYVLAGAFGPLIATYPALWLFTKWRLVSWTDVYLGFGGVALVFLLSTVIGGRWVWNKFNERRNHLLGYLGERSVAEALASLLTQGYRIFHDFPAEASGKNFNLDHIAVGPTGVFALETKTRRKRRARPGFKEHEVVFDGQQLIWPWGEDRNGLAQAERQAKWLDGWLRQRTGIDVATKPVLVLPGWYVIAKARGTVNVVNAKGACSAVKGRGQRVLSDEQIDLIARQLEDRCRDVED